MEIVQMKRGYEAIVKCYSRKYRYFEQLFQQVEAINHKLIDCEFGANIADVKKHLNIFPNYEYFEKNINQYLKKRIFSRRLTKKEKVLIWAIIGKDKQPDSIYHKLIIVTMLIIRLLDRSIADGNKALSQNSKLSWINNVIRYVKNIRNINLSQLEALKGLDFAKVKQDFVLEKQVLNKLNLELYKLAVEHPEYFSLFSNLKPVSRRSFMKMGVLGIAATITFTAVFSYSNWQKIYLRTIAPDKIDPTLDLYKQHHNVHFICLKFLDEPDSNFKMFEDALWDWIKLYGPDGNRLKNSPGDAPEHFIWAIDHILLNKGNEDLKKDLLILLMKVSIFYNKHDFDHSWCAMEIFIYGQPFVRRTGDGKVINEWRKLQYKSIKAKYLGSGWEYAVTYYAMWLTSFESLGVKRDYIDGILRDIGKKHDLIFLKLAAKQDVHYDWGQPKQVADYNYNYLFQDKKFNDFLNQIKQDIPFWPEDCN